jgi:hypothetical protein
MRRIVMSVLACAMLSLAGVGCSHQDVNEFQAFVSNKPSEAELAKQAIRAVMEETCRLDNAFRAKLDADPSQFRKGISAHLSQLDAIDLSKCPMDFSVAYMQYVRAEQKRSEVILQMPSGSVGEALAGVLRGELDGGASRSKRDVDSATDRSEAAQFELFKVAAKYNVGR